MKNTITLFFCLLSLTICSNIVLGQSKSKKSNNLKLSVNQYAAKVIQSLNKSGSMGKYRVKGKNTFNDDIDGDGDFDAIVELFFCEYNSCHPTTNSSKLVVFLNNKGIYQFAADKTFVLYGKINSIEDGKIYVNIYGLEGDDPQCCPQLKRGETYSLKENKLIKSR